MLYLYDAALCDDLNRSFNQEVANPVVRVFDPEHIIDLVSQIQDDKITYPILALERSPDINIDEDRVNFTRLHRGVHAVFDNQSNNWYNEKVFPIMLSYTLSVITTNTADMDELVRELIFKYSDMYFLKIQLPYESSRSIRFGVRLDYSSTISRQSSSSEYITSGQLYRTKLSLICDGCVLVTYTPVKLKRQTFNVTAAPKHRL